ncbi:MAG: hypothetical protein HC887_00865 [Desulfobacteraceae bacterium]|nr:hypothetical protein [Desulfobacteraceae bacterium]
MPNLRRIKSDENASPDGGKNVASPDIPIFDINAEFRVNREHEYMANRIIEWRLNAGGHSFRNGEALHTGQWRFGEPIMFTLRWAKDAKEYPIFGGYHAVTDERERAVSYKFDNQWSLLRFLRLHEGHIGDFDLPSDPKPHTLKFLIVTQKEGAESEEEGKFTTRAYIRVMMMTPGKPKTMLTMPYFPEIAPELKIEKDIF